MAEDKKITIPVLKAEKSEGPSQGELVLAELQNIGRLLGAINQNITQSMEQIKDDVEMIKVNLGHIKKQDNSPSPVTPKAPEPYTPPSMGVDI